MSNEKLTIKEAMLKSADFLKNRGITSARLDAEILLAHVLKTERLNLYLKFDTILTEKEKDAYRECLKRRSRFEPVAYITGKKEFMSLSFTVSPAVLIPRPETELLVEKSIETIKTLQRSGRSEITVFEIGAGSGAVCISIAKMCDGVRFIASDVSENTLRVARHNARTHGAENNIVFRQGSLFADLTDNVDLVISNPPYIAEETWETLMPDVRDFEPKEALVAGETGLETIEHIVRKSPCYLNSGGFLLMEIDPPQENEIRRIIESADAFGKVEFFEYDSQPRVARVKKEGK